MCQKKIEVNGVMVMMMQQLETKDFLSLMGQVMVCGQIMVVHLFKKMDLEDAFFLVGKVTELSGKVLWTFPKARLRQIAILLEVQGEKIVAFLEKGRKGAVVEVIPLSKLYQPISVVDAVRLKVEAAEYLNRPYKLSEAEHAVLDLLQKRQREAEAEGARLARENREKNRLIRLNSIRGRGNVTGYTPDGYQRYGLPVVGDEWHVLDHGVFVVLVESYDEGARTPGRPIEAFAVCKTVGGKVSKEKATPVSWERPASKTSSPQVIISPVAEVVCELRDGEFFPVMVYESFDQVRQAREQGLNGGAYVTARDRLVDGEFEVFSVRAEGIQTEGKFSSL